MVMTAALGLLIGAGAALLRHVVHRNRSRTVRKRLSAYDATVSILEDHDRFQRVG